ncbi:MAG: hypothetical protein ACD_65C00344G0001 [uncultured bacterium]|nr:MAG: hypothetical protein ACD_65C00344G0001 [uncultured bacterium]
MPVGTNQIVTLNLIIFTNYRKNIVRTASDSPIVTFFIITRQWINFVKFFNYSRDTSDRRCRLLKLRLRDSLKKHAFKLPNAIPDIISHKFKHFRRYQNLMLSAFRMQNRQTSLKIGELNVYNHSHLKTTCKPLFKTFELFGRLIGTDYYLFTVIV